jgi:hypothetical protein
MLEGRLLKQLSSLQTEPPEHPLVTDGFDAFINEPGHW